MGIKSNMFCSAPQNTVDYEHFAVSVTIFDKKPQGGDDLCYVIVPSKVGSIISCKWSMVCACVVAVSMFSEEHLKLNCNILEQCLWIIRSIFCLSVLEIEKKTTDWLIDWVHRLLTKLWGTNNELFRSWSLTMVYKTWIYWVGHWMLHLPKHNYIVKFW